MCKYVKGTMRYVIIYFMDFIAIIIFISFFSVSRNDVICFLFPHKKTRKKGAYTYGLKIIFIKIHCIAILLWVELYLP